MIACVSPADFNASESESTLTYANRARNITNKPVKNIDPNKAQIAALKQQLLTLYNEMQDMKAAGGAGAQQEEKIENLKMELDAALQTAKNASARQLQAEMERDQIRTLMAQHGLEGESLGEVSREEMDVIEHHVRTIQEQDAKILELQLRLDNGCVQGLDEAALEGEEEIQKEEAEHEDRLKDMEAEMLALMEGLADKEKDIDAVNSNITEDQFKALSTEYDSLKAEHSALLNKMESASFEENKALQRKVSILEKQMKDAKKKQEDYKRLKTMQARGELRVKEVENEMETLKKKKVSLTRKMTEESRKFTDWKAERTREVSSLKRDAQRKTYELSKMAGAKAQTERVLKRKMEEIASANRRMKGMSEQLARAKKNRTTTATRGTGLHRTNSGSSLTQNKAQAAAEKRKWLEEEIGLAVKVRAAKRALEKETEEKILKETELEMMKANLERLTERGASEDSIKKIGNAVSDSQMEMQGKKDLIVELQKQLQGTEDIQSAVKRWEGVKQFDEAKGYLKTLFGLSCLITEQKDEAVEKSNTEAEKARVAHAQVVQRLFQQRAEHAKAMTALEQKHEIEVAAALTNQISDTEVAKMLATATADKGKLEVEVAEATQLFVMMERELTNLKSAFEERDIKVAAPAAVVPAPMEVENKESEALLLNLEAKYKAMETAHNALKEEHSNLKKEHANVRQAAKKKRKSGDLELPKVKPTWNSGLSSVKTKEELAEIEKMKKEKEAMPRKPALPKEAFAPAVKKEDSAKENAGEDDSESDFESGLSDGGYSDSDSDFEYTPVKKKKQNPAHLSTLQSGNNVTPFSTVKETVKEENIKENTTKATVKPAAEKEKVVPTPDEVKNMTEPKIKALLVPVLRSVLTELGLDTTGYKPALVARVIAWRESEAEEEGEEEEQVEWGEPAEPAEEGVKEDQEEAVTLPADAMPVLSERQQLKLLEGAAESPAPVASRAGNSDEIAVNKTTSGGATIQSNMKKKDDSANPWNERFKSIQNTLASTPKGEQKKRKLHNRGALGDMDPNEDSPAKRLTPTKNTMSQNEEETIVVEESPQVVELTERLSTAAVESTEPKVLSSGLRPVLPSGITAGVIQN